MARGRSAGLKTYWRTVHAVASRTDRSIKDARAIVREGRARGNTHTAIRGITRQRAGVLLKSDRAKAPARTRTKESRADRTRFDFGANVPAPEVFEERWDDLTEWIDHYDDLEPFDLEPPEDFDANPDYEET